MACIGGATAGSVSTPAGRKPVGTTGSGTAAVLAEVSLKSNHVLQGDYETSTVLWCVEMWPYRYLSLPLLAIPSRLGRVAARVSECEPEPRGDQSPDTVCIPVVRESV